MRAPKAPKEDPAIKAEREREKRISEGERRYAATRNAASMTTDYNAVYGRRSLFGKGTVRESAPLRATGGTGLVSQGGGAYAPASLLQRDRSGMETARPVSLVGAPRKSAPARARGGGQGEDELWVKPSRRPIDTDEGRRFTGVRTSEAFKKGIRQAFAQSTPRRTFITINGRNR